MTNLPYYLIFLLLKIYLSGPKTKNSTINQNGNLSKYITKALKDDEFKKKGQPRMHKNEFRKKNWIHPRLIYEIYNKDCRPKERKIKLFRSAKKSANQRNKKYDLLEFEIELIPF